MPLTAHLGTRYATHDGRFWAILEASFALKADQLSEGDRGDTQRIPPGGTPAYELVNLTVGTRLDEHFELSVQLANVFDEAYRSHGSGSNEPGFGVNVGIVARF
jgi:outer membrane receptor protein involved in Fe transport